MDREVSIDSSPIVDQFWDEFGEIWISDRRYLVWADASDVPIPYTLTGRCYADAGPISTTCYLYCRGAGNCHWRTTCR